MTSVQNMNVVFTLVALAFCGVTVVCIVKFWNLLTKKSSKKMEAQRQTENENFEVQSIKGGQFQLWKPKDTEIRNNVNLVVMFGPYGFTRRLISKYCDIYFRRGLAVLYIPNYIAHFTRPDVTLKLASDLMEYLDTEAAEYSNILVHSFSAGSVSFNICNYGYISKHLDKYGHIKDKIKAVVYDSYSIGPPDDRPYAMSKGITVGRGRLLQILIHGLLSTFFWVQHKTVKQFNEWQEMCRTDPIAVPTLYFLCETDPMSDFRYIHDMIEDIQKVKKFPILEKCWKKSRHSAHFMVHTEEYLDYINKLFQLVPELTGEKPKPVRSKI